jgi:hypothetical protein
MLGIGLGVTCIQSRLSQSGGAHGGSLPDGALWMINFRDGIYNDGSGDGDVTDMVADLSDPDGYPFLPEQIQPGVGYVGPGDIGQPFGATGGIIIGAALTSILAGCVVLVEFVEADVTETNPTNGVNLDFYTSPGFDSQWSSFCQVNGSTIYDGTNNTKANTDDTIANGTVKFATLFSSAAISQSVNGGEIVTNPNPGEPVPIDTLGFETFSDKVTIVSITGYSANADLQALSA